MNNTIEVLQEIKKYYAQDTIRGTETGSKRFKAIDEAIANEKALESAGDMLDDTKDMIWDIMQVALDKNHYITKQEELEEILLDCKIPELVASACQIVLAKQILKVEELEEYKKFVEKYRLHQPENPNDERSWLPIVFDRDSKIKELEDTIEQLRVQLAVCGVAALGYAKGKNDCKKGDYGWSVSFEDVKRMRAELEAKIKEIENESPR